MIRLSMGKSVVLKKRGIAFGGSYSLKQIMGVRWLQGEGFLPLLLGQESVSSFSEFLIPNPPLFRLGLWVALLAE
jgi:hypothetical protein